MILDEHIQNLKARLPQYLRSIHAHRIDESKSNDRHILMTCPYHEDKTPSLNCDEKQGVWVAKCFGCSWAGTIIDFALADTGKGKWEAIQHCAKVTGYVLPKSEAPTAQEMEKRKREKSENARKQSQIQREESKTKNMNSRTQKKLRELLKPYASHDWRADFFHESPIMGWTNEKDPHALISTLFSPADILWCGEPKDSGKHPQNFKTAEEWVGTDPESIFPYSRISPSTYKLDSISRSKDNIKETRYLCIESDDIIGKKPETDKEKQKNKAMSAALIRFLKDKTNLVLRAVIDTGNKSLHSWWEMPDADEMKSLRRLSAGLSIDESCLDGVCSPLRLPDFKHEKTGIQSTLLYLT